MRGSVARVEVETEGAQVSERGNEVATSFQRDKAFAVRCWQDAVAASGLDDKAIAAECGMSRGYYSKVASGQQGDLIELAYRLPGRLAFIRADFFDRLAQSEQHDPLGHATEQMAVAAIRFLRAARAASQLPRRASRMAKVGQ